MKGIIASLLGQYFASNQPVLEKNTRDQHKVQTRWILVRQEVHTGYFKYR